MLVARGVQPTLQMDIPETSFTEETTELAHEPSIKPSIVLIRCLINHIEVAA
jgi:hypothetical protein